MELKLYTQILLRQWRLIAAAFGITVLFTAILVSRQPWVYEATTTLVIRPRPDFTEAADDFVRAIDTLSRHTEINTTFSQVAGSRIVRQRAIERLGLSDQERKGLQVSGAAIAGSSVLEITARGPRPDLVRDYANAVGLEATEYMRDLYDVFELELLDEATLPSRPSAPNKTLTLAVGAMFGLMLGVALVFVSEYLQQPLVEERNYNIADPETGLYNKTYFLSRLAQEMSRTENSDHIFSVAIIRLKTRQVATGITRPISGREAVAPLVDALGVKLRKEDVFAHVGNSLFALLLPAMSEDAAGGLLQPLEERVRSLMAARTERESDATTDTIASVVTYASSNVFASEQVLFDHVMDQLSDRDDDLQEEITSSHENSSGLSFLPGIARNISRERQDKTGR